MWSILSQIEQPWLRAILFVGLAPLMWLALMAHAAVTEALAPAFARIARRRRG